MTFEVEVNGRVRIVSVEVVDAPSLAGAAFRVRVDGVAHVVDSRPTDLGLSLRYAESGRTIDVAMTDRGRGERLIQLPHVLVEATVDARRYRRVGGARAAASGELRVTAPMPGRVVRILAAPGDQVEAGQGLIVIEAMKMENELTAAKAGRVKEVPVSPGQSVEAGRLLMTVE
jgi:biotin carboxyl carrier protein